MNNIMAVFLNGIAQLEYDRDKLLPDHQAAYLDKMDTKMDAALNSEDEATAAAMCSYLAIRLPELKQVMIEEEEGEISIQFIFDEPYRKQVAVEFTGLH
jgi:hypothetical protein